MAKKNTATYSAEHIQTLEWPDNVRKNASQYIGGTDAQGVWNICRELLDNSIDERLAGRNNGVALYFDKDGSYWVQDGGAGIPQGVKTNGAGKKVPTMEAVFSALHTSGKYRDDAYKVSIGCFVGETEIRLLNGRIVTFDQLYARWQKNKKRIPIMTWDTKEDKVAYSNISHVQLSKMTRDLVKVKLSSGDTITCTPDHPFFVRTTEGIKKIPASKLEAAASLVAVHLKDDGDGYLYSYDLNRNLEGGPRQPQRSLHRSVYEFYNPGEVQPGLHQVHHHNRNRQDNRPSNLEITTVKQHHIEHADAMEFVANYNHSVVSVTPYRSPKPVAVYGMTVDNQHTYFVEPGVLVANTHGIGAKGTNATSLFFDAWTCYEGKWYSVQFKQGRLIKPVAPCKAPKGPFGVAKKGTLIHYKPDPEIFSVKAFPAAMASEWATVMAYMNPGFKIVLATPTKRKEFYKPGGTKEYIKDRLAELKAEAEADVFEFTNGIADVVVSFSSFDGCDLRGFTNGLHNKDGGYHVDAVSKAMYRALSALKGAKQEFSRREFDDGLVGLVNAKLHKASFSSQDKAKLTDTRVSTEFEEQVFAAAKKFFSSNKAMAQRLLEKACKLADLKNKFKASKKVVTALNAVKRTGLPPNYAPADRKVPVKDRELFIVEGDSAAGGFRKVRARHQSLLPLSGKIANLLKLAAKARKSKKDQNVVEKALLSKAIMALMSAVGYDPRAKDAIKKMQVGRIICLADADPDGGHINSLLLGFFYQMMPEVFEAGMVYIADMPEYISEAGGRLVVGNSGDEVQTKLKKLGIKGNVKHLKGWGEADPEVLRVLAVNNSRKLIQIKPITSEDETLFEAIMATDVDARREALGISEEVHHE